MAINDVLCDDFFPQRAQTAAIRVRRHVKSYCETYDINRDLRHTLSTGRTRPQPYSHGVNVEDNPDEHHEVTEKLASKAKERAWERDHHTKLEEWDGAANSNSKLGRKARTLQHFAAKHLLEEMNVDPGKIFNVKPTPKKLARRKSVVVGDFAPNAHLGVVGLVSKSGHTPLPKKKYGNVSIKVKIVHACVRALDAMHRLLNTSVFQ